MHHHFGRQPKMHHHFGRQLPTAFSCRSGPAPLASRPIGREPASPTTRDRRTEYNGRRHRLLDSWHFDPAGNLPPADLLCRSRITISAWCKGRCGHRLRPGRSGRRPAAAIVGIRLDLQALNLNKPLCCRQIAKPPPPRMANRRESAVSPLTGTGGRRAGNRFPVRCCNNYGAPVVFF